MKTWGIPVYPQKLKGRRAALAGAAIAACMLPNAAMSASVFVNDDAVVQADSNSCTRPQFNAIQPAVNAAAAGDTIVVCAGTYTEQVVVDKSVTLSGRGLPVIKAPPMLMPFFAGSGFEERALVEFKAGASPAGINNFVLRGPQQDPNGCANSLAGIFVGGGANATIKNNFVLDMRNEDLETLGGCQVGEGIRVGARFANQVGTALIERNTIANYQKNGITVDNLGTSVNILDNRIRGFGPTNLIAQNGIQVGRKARGLVKGNEIAGNIYGPDTYTASGIILFEVNSLVRVRENRLDRNDVAVSVDSIDTPTGPLIVGNTIRRSPAYGIALYTYVDGTDRFPTTKTLVRQNNIQATGLDGIFVDLDSVDNTLDRNTSLSSIEHDCHDDNPGATPAAPNTWTDNRGEYSFPAGLCVPTAGGDGSPAAKSAQSTRTARRGGKHDGDRQPSRR